MNAPDASWAKSAALPTASTLDATMKAFLAADAASQQAWSSLTRAQICGPDPVPAEAEYLRGEAQHYWDLLATGWPENLLPKRVREAGAEYVRPKIVHAPVVQSGPVDWSQSGRAA